MYLFPFVLEVVIFHCLDSESWRGYLLLLTALSSSWKSVRILFRIFASVFLKDRGVCFCYIEFLSGACIRTILASSNEFGTIPSLYITLKTLRSIGVRSSMKVL